MSGGFAADGDGNCECEGLPEWPSPGLLMCELILEYAGLQFDTCGDEALMVGGEAVAELEYWYETCRGDACGW